jgi:uncharacterized membrane protein YtjA (UPF0391 family)
MLAEHFVGLAAVTSKKPFHSRAEERGTAHAISPGKMGAEARQEESMLYYAIVFFVIALIAAFFGFSGIAAGAAGIGKLLFIGFMVLAVISGVAMLVGGRRRLP